MADNPFDAFKEAPQEVASNPFDAFKGDTTATVEPVENPFDNFKQPELQMQTPTLAPEPPKNQFDLGAVMNVMGQAPIVQEMGKAVQSPGDFLNAVDSFESGAPLALAGAQDTAAGLSNLVTDTLSNATEEALGPNNPFGFTAKEFQNHIHAPTHNVDALKKLLPSANTALAETGSLASQLGAAMLTGGGSALGGATKLPAMIQGALKGAGMMGAISGVQSAGRQYGASNTIDPKQLALDTGIGATFGGGGGALSTGMARTKRMKDIVNFRSARQTAKEVEQAHLQNLAATKAEVEANHQAAQQAEAKAAATQAFSNTLAQAHANEAAAKVAEEQAKQKAIADAVGRWKAKEQVADAASHSNVRKEAVGIREKAVPNVEHRAATHEEANHFGPMLDAKLALDHKTNHLNQALENLRSHLEAMGGDTSNSLKKSRLVQGPEETAALREAARVEAGIKDQLKARTFAKGNVIAHHENPPFSDYQMQGKESVMKAAEAAHLDGEVKRLHAEYTALRIAAKIENRILPGQTIAVEKNGYKYYINHAIDKRYDPPLSASAQERLDYKRLYGEKAAAAMEEAQKLNKEMKPHYEGLIKDLKELNPEAAKILKTRGKVLEDLGALHAAEKAGVKNEFIDFVKSFMTNESGSFTPEHSFVLVTSPAKWLIKAVKDGVRMARNAGLRSDWFQTISMTRLNAHIIELHNPVFATDFANAKRLYGKARLINGKPVELPTTHAGMKAWSEKLSDAEIDALKNDKFGNPILSKNQKTALKAMNAAKDNIASLIREEQRGIRQRGKYAMAVAAHQDGELPHIDEKLQGLTGDDREKALEDLLTEAAKKMKYKLNVWSPLGSYDKTLSYELAQNFTPPPISGNSYRPVWNHIAHSFANYVQFSSASIHGGVHFTEAITTNFASAPVGATKAMSAYIGMATRSAVNILNKQGVNESTERQFVKLFGYNAPDYNLLKETSENWMSNTIGKTTDWMKGKMPILKGNKVTRFIQSVGSGKAPEQEFKLPFSLFTATERVAHALNKTEGQSEMQVLLGKGDWTGAKVRAAIVSDAKLTDADLKDGKGAMTLAQSIKAHFLIADHMRETTGAAVDGLSEMGAVDRLAAETNDFSKPFVPLARAMFRFTGYFTHNSAEAGRKAAKGVSVMMRKDATDAAKKAANGDLVEAAGHARAVVMGAGILTSLNGAYAAPGWLREGINLMDPSGKALKEFDDHMEGFAVIGNTAGTRVPHVSIEPLPILRVGNNLFANTVEDIDKATGHRGPSQQRNAVAKLACMASGQAALFDTVGIEALVKGLSHWQKAEEVGGSVDWAYTNDGPMGLWKGRYINSRVEPKSPAQAAAEAVFQPGHKLESAAFSLHEDRNEKARVNFKNKFGKEVYDEYHQVYAEHFAESEEWRQTEKELKQPPEPDVVEAFKNAKVDLAAHQQKQIQKAQREYAEAHRRELDTDMVLSDGSRIKSYEFWTRAWDYALKETKEPAPLTSSSPIASK